MEKLHHFFRGWTWTRWVAFGLGLFFLWDYFRGYDGFSMLMAGIMLSQSLLGIGCMGGQCYPAQGTLRDTTDQAKDVEVEVEIVQ